MKTMKEIVKEKYSYFSKFCDHLIQSDEKIIEKINTSKEREVLPFMSKCFTFSEDTGLRDDADRRIFLAEVSWHDVAVSCNISEEEFIDQANNSGACCIGIHTRDVTTGEKEDVDLVLINRDVYDIFSECDMKYVKYFVIAHEIGHCMNGDCYIGDHDRSIREEIEADIRGYEFLYTGWFGEFKFNTDRVMVPTVRRMQHILNCLMMHFGRKNADYIMKQYFSNYNGDYAKLFQEFWLDDGRYLNQSEEDLKRRKVFEQYFDC